VHVRAVDIFDERQSDRVGIAKIIANQTRNWIKANLPACQQPPLPDEDFEVPVRCWAHNQW
jgi:hypothetical protein